MQEELFSVRMRAAEGGSHEDGGFHISGGETLVAKRSLEAAVQELLQKALLHSRGDADFIQIVMERIAPCDILRVPPLPVTTAAADHVQEGRLYAMRYLQTLCISEQAARKGIELLASQTNLRGAAIMSASSGERLDEGLRGIRATRMGWTEEGYKQWASRHTIASPRVAEALALATKVAHAPFVLAELCWSDDPEYATGYISSLMEGYVRIPHLKEKGDFSGGRVFYVSDDVRLEELIVYLEKTPILIDDI